MSLSREPIYAALFARLQAVPGLVTVSRRLKHWHDVPPADQPSLYQSQQGESTTTTSGQPTIWRLSVDLYLYARAPDGDTSSAPILNPLLDAIENALKPDNPVTNTCTLGGLVQYARISGRIETDEGSLGDQAVAIIPIEILVT